VITKTNFGVTMFETLKACPDERATLLDRIKSIETELIKLGDTRGNRKDWAEKWDQLLTEFFDLKAQVGRK
jgi:hypothetical protein